MIRCAFLTVLSLVVSTSAAAGGGAVETRISAGGLSKATGAVRALLPDSIALPDTKFDLYSCDGADASLQVTGAQIGLEVHSLSISQPIAGQVVVDVDFSSLSVGQLDFDRVLFCSGELSCQSTLSVDHAKASVTLQASADGRSLEVANVDLDIDADDFDLELSGCPHGETISSLVDLVDDIAIPVTQGALENLAKNQLSNSVQGLVGGVSTNTKVLNWDLVTDLETIDLSGGLRARAQVDLSSPAELASCLHPASQPESRGGHAPQLAGDFDIGMDLDLAIIDDLLYQAWVSSARCPATEEEANALGDYLPGFPRETTWTLRSTVLSPLRVEGKNANSVAMTMAMDDIRVTLEATLPNGDRQEATLEFDARADVELAIEGGPSALALRVRNPRVTHLVMVDELQLSDLGFDAARIQQYLNSEYLPKVLSSVVGRDVRLPLAFGAEGIYGIIRGLATNQTHSSIGLDLFVAPSDDQGAPDTELIDVPMTVVSAADARVLIGGSDAEVPSELLRYQVQVQGVELPVSATGHITIPSANRSGRYQVEVAAMDLAGNVDPSPVAFELEVDGVAPTVELDSQADGGHVNVSFEASDDRSATSELRARVVLADVDTGRELRSEDLAAGQTTYSEKLPDAPSGVRVTVTVIDEVGNEGSASSVIATSAQGGCSAASGSGDLAGLLGVLLFALFVSRVRAAQHSRLRALLPLIVLGACNPTTPSDTELPECASELATAIWQDMQAVAARGTIPMDYVLGTSSAVDPNLLISGPEIFSTWADLIEEARAEINMQFYKWEPETDATETILLGIKRLEERARARAANTAIVVRIVIDTSTLGAAAPITEDHMPWVMERIESYGFDPEFIDLRFAVVERGLLNQFGNLHVKTMVVDGRVAVITGANPEHQHDFDTPWHDVGAVFYGDVVAAVQEDFEFTWKDAQRWTCASLRGTSDCLQPVEPLRPLPLAVSQRNTSNVCMTLALTRKASALTNNDIDNPQNQAFLSAFRNAKQVIKIETPNINDDAVKKALIDAVERGVEVRLITSKEFNEAAQGFVGGPNGANIAELYRELALRGHSGSCSKLKVRWYSRDGRAPVVGNGPYASHVKYTSVDDQVVIIGTTNMDTASWNFSHEFNIAIDDRKMTQTLNSQLFDADWERAITVDECSE